MTETGHHMHYMAFESGNYETLASLGERCGVSETFHRAERKLLGVSITALTTLGGG